MKQWLSLTGWSVAVSAILLGLGAIASVGEEPPKAQFPAPYLANATYLTSTKCKMCHSPVFQAWSATKHGALNKALPWEKDGKLPAADVIYRHTTGYNPATNTWAEKGIACEACHGPGSEHMKATKATRKDTILNPSKLDTPGKQVSLCGRCHGQYTINGQKYAAQYFPGQDLLLVNDFKLDPVQPNKAMQQMNEMVISKHFAKGMTCLTCHQAHSATPAKHNLRKSGSALCQDCHKEKTMAEHAPKAAADATCSTCHMPNGMHTFTKLVD